MAFGIKASHITALVIAGAVVGWMATGNIVVGGQANSVNATPPPAERNSEDDTLFKVRYVTVNPEVRPNTILVRGRTQADSITPVRAETPGTLKERLVNKGDYVKPGDLVCELDPGVRESAINRAKATLEQAKHDYEGAVSLQERGFSANTRVMALKAALDSAVAGLAEARQELERASIRATTSGTVQDPIAEVGDNLRIGDVCVTLIDADPMLFIGQVSERQVGEIEVGGLAGVQLISGETVFGTIRYVSPSADAATRTFLVEIEMPNTDNKLRDGVTAAALIKLDGTEAYRIQPSWLTLDDDGSIGVRVIVDNDQVAFRELKIVEHTPETMWVTGLAPDTRLITVGQDYVVPGQTVEPVAAEATAQTVKEDTKS